MKKAMIYGGTSSLGLIALGTVFKIMHWPGAALLLIIGFALLCFVFFPSALYLNYAARTEKNKLAINLSALVGGISLMLGVLWKIMHWPGSAMLLLIGWSLLLLVYLPLLLFSKIKETDDKAEKNSYVLGVIALIIFELATMFKFMHWPGAGPMLLVGSFLLIAVFLPIFTRIKMQKNKLNAGQFTFLITIAMYATVLTSLLSINVSVPVLQHFVNEENTNAKLIAYFKNKKEKATVSDSLSQLTAGQYAQIQNSADKIKTLVNELKTDLIAKVEHLDQQAATGYISHPNDLRRIDNYDLVNAELFGPNGNPKLKSLKTELSNFKNTVLEVLGDTSLSALFDTSDKPHGESTRSWEELRFRNNFLIGALNQLSEIERNVLLVESQLK
jgi:hypothetical protein